MQERIFAIAGHADAAVLVLLCALGVVSLIIIFERWRVLSRVTAQSRQHQHTIDMAIAERDLALIKTVATEKNSLEGRAVAYALDHLQRSDASGIDEVFATISNKEKQRLERSLGFLATVGANAPYIGLFGTVLGIMKAFHDMGQSADPGQQSVMAGISAALIATAAGLMVAIPAVLAFNYFQRQVKFVLGSLNSCRDIVIAWKKQQGGIHGRTS